MEPEPIDVPAAWRELQEKKGTVYLDVRTEEEFAAGHPEGAINVPIGIANPALQRLEANPDFLAVTRAAVPAETPLLVGCAAGPRAQMAARLLAGNGYREVRWVLGGMHGVTDPMGRVLAPGWTALGLPESREAGDGAAYRSLRRKAGLD